MAEPFPRARDQGIYERLLTAIDIVERFASPGFKGWQQGELWALLAPENSVSWPSHIASENWSERVGQMLDLGNPQQGAKRALELKSLLVELGLGIPPNISKKRREDRIQYLAKHKHIQTMPGKRWRGNPLGRNEHLLNGGKLLNDPFIAQVRPVYGFGLRNDLLPLERQAIEKISTRIEDLMGALAMIHGVDKTNIPMAGKPTIASDAWGKPAKDPFCILAKAYPSALAPTGYEGWLRGLLDSNEIVGRDEA